MYERIDRDQAVIITNERYAELIRKEEQLTIIERFFKSGKCVFAEDIRLIMGVEAPVTEGKE